MHNFFLRGKWKIACAACLLFLAVGGDGLPWARSAHSPRHSGIEPPGGPRPMETLPGRSFGRTDEGGMGYTDAYGNTVEKKMPQTREPRRRLHHGAYGSFRKTGPDAQLPDVGGNGQKPLWDFDH